MSDPFTRTPGIAGGAFIDMHYADRIIKSFEDEASYKYIYKIVGLRGSGKSVEYSKIIEKMSEKSDWLVYTLSAAGEMVQALIAKISDEPFIDSQTKTTTYGDNASVGGGIPFLSGEISTNISVTSTQNSAYYSAEATLEKMVKKAGQEGFKILVGVDDIVKTQYSVEFLSILGAMILRKDTRVYFVCTGLAKNIEDFSDEPNLTFFKRSDLVEIGSLSKYDVAAMYQKLLNVSMEDAANMAKFVRGYAYAYQVLGSLYYNKKSYQVLEDLYPQFDRILFADSYDLIWKSLTLAEQELVKCIIKSGTNKVSDVKNIMDNPASYPVLRNRLELKHVINCDTRGYVSIELPRFKEFVEMWS